MTELREKNPSELKTLYTECVEEQFKLRFQSGSENTVRTHEFKRLQKQIARIQTLITMKSKEGQS